MKNLTAALCAMALLGLALTSCTTAQVSRGTSEAEYTSDTVKTNAFGQASVFIVRDLTGRVTQWYEDFSRDMLSRYAVRKFLRSLQQGEQPDHMRSVLTDLTTRIEASMWNRHLLWESAALYGRGSEYAALDELRETMKEVRTRLAVDSASSVAECEEASNAFAVALADELEPRFRDVSLLLLRSSIGYTLQRLKANIIGPYFPPEDATPI